jgi:hypothetical protein
MHKIAAALAAVALMPSQAMAGTPGPARPHVDLQDFELKPDLPAASGPRKATKLVYVMGAHGIWTAGARSTVQELSAQKALSPTAYSLAFVGGIEEDAALYSFGDEPALTTRKSPLAPGIKQVPANSLQLMSKVLAWAYAAYPSEARYLEIDSHGGGVFGIGTDEASPYLTPGKAMPIQGLARALRDGSRGQPIDVVFFNACEMASIEALYEIAPSVRYAVASELPISDSAHTVISDQPLLLERLAREGLPPAQVARELARLAMGKGSEGVRTEVAIETAKLEPLVAAVARLSAALLQSPDRWLLARVLRDTGDLWVIARNLEKLGKSPEVKAAAHALFRLQAGATLYERSSRGTAASVRSTERGSILGPPALRTKLNDAGGLSIYSGGSGAKFLNHGYAQTRFARATGWDKVLRAIGRQ